MAGVVRKLRIGIVAMLVLACSSSGGGAFGSNYITCTSDGQCPDNQGCNLDAPSGDGYCSPLCRDDADCPPQASCPSLSRDRAPDCQERRKGQGICEQFEGSYGPHTCASAGPRPGAPGG
jgi:hypothetical protein